MNRYSGLKKVGVYDARTRWARVTNAVARHMAGPRPTADDLADAEDAIGDYIVWRATTQGDPTTDMLGRSIRNAIAARGRYEVEGL